MPFIAKDPNAHLGEVVDNGHCLRHVQIVASVPHSSKLRRGANVREARLATGTVVGTFDDAGRYANATDGSSHVAVLIRQDPEGLLVIDQWVGQPVHERVIRFKAGHGPACDDADRYFIVEAVA
jgi:hypothetical protein